MVFVLWAVATILFFMFRLMPGTPLAAFIDSTLTEEQQLSLIRQFGLDQPLYEQYWKFLVNLLQGDLGQSFFFRKPVTEVVLSVFPNTVLLTVTSLLIAYAFGIVVGAFLAWKRGTWFERIGIPIVLTSRAAPEFWMGMVLLAIFGFHLHWFPSGGANATGSYWEND